MRFVLTKISPLSEIDSEEIPNSSVGEMPETNGIDPTPSMFCKKPPSCGVTAKNLSLL